MTRSATHGTEYRLLRDLISGSQDDLCMKIVSEGLPLSGRAWDRISAEAKDLLLGLLKKDPKERLTSADATQV